MHGAVLLVALSALGVDHTWRQTQDGQVEYVLQVEPVYLQALAEGKEIASVLPADVERVDRLCIRIGSRSLKTLPQQAPDWPELEQTVEQRAAETTTPDTLLAVYLKANGDAFESYDVAHGWQPASETESTYLVQLDPAFLEMLTDGDEVYAAIRPEAGLIRSFKLTAGRGPLPREAARPPVVKVAQHQAQGPRTSSPAADVPPVSDFTGGAGSSIYAPEVTDLGTDAASAGSNFAGQDDGQSAAAAMQPKANPLLDVPQFDPNQFRKPRNTAGSSGRTSTSRTGTRPPTGASTTPRFPAQPSTGQPRGDGTIEDQQDQDLSERVASRTTGSRSLTSDQLPDRRTNLPGQSAQTDKEPEFPAMPFTLSLIALFLSIGGNLYLAWTAAEFYSRYKLAVERLRSAGRN